jgi:hypothetical protein
MVDEEEAKELLREGAKQMGTELDEGVPVKALYINSSQMAVLMNCNKNIRFCEVIRAAGLGIGLSSIIIFIVGGGYGWLVSSLVAAVFAQRGSFYKKEWQQTYGAMMEIIRATEHTCGE